MTVPRTPSGIPGLDPLIEGGIPTNSSVALRAEPSNHSEYFMQQFVAEGLNLGSCAVYCCLSRPAASVIKSMKHQGFDVVEAVANDQLVFLDCYSMNPRTALLGVDPAIQRKIITVTEPDEEELLQQGLSTAVENVQNLRGVRAVCENVAGTLTKWNAMEMMRWGRKAFGDLRAYDAVSLHAFPIGIREDLFTTMAHDFDGIFEIVSERANEHMKFYLHVRKMRMTDVPQRMFELETEDATLSLKTVQKIT